MAARLTYSALVRTHQSAPLVFDVLRDLRQQTHPPAQIIVVDSGSAAGECEQLRELSDVFIDISGQTFNFSRAINVGIPHCTGTHLLVISSHLRIEAPDLISRAVAAMAETGAASFYLYQKDDADWHVERIDLRTFDGYNGYSNTCGFVALDAVRARPFREDVFSAEDQEWGYRLLQAGGFILRIGSRHVKYLNARFNYTKKLNEEVAIAYFVLRKRLGYPNIAKWMLRALFSTFKFDWAKARFKFAVANELIKARGTVPRKSSRYF